RELSEVYLQRGDSKRALSKLQICFKANPRELTTLQLLARAFQDLGQVSKTVSVLKELARVHADQGETTQAREAYQRAVELAPDDAEARQAMQALEGGQPARPAAKPAPRPPPPPANLTPPIS